MTQSAELILREFSGTPEITPAAHQLKESALGKAATVKQVTTEPEQLVAVEALRLLSEIRRGVEASRKSVNAPVLALQRQINSIASDFLLTVNQHESRLEGLINHYQRKKFEDEKARELEAQRQQTTVEQLKEKLIGLRIKGDHTEANKVEEHITELELNAETEEQPLTIPKPKGLVVKKRISFQITDPIINVQAFPQFWRPGKNGDHENEVLKLDRQTVLDELNREDGKGIFHRSKFPEELPAKEGELVKPPGMRVFEDLKTHVR